MENPTPATAPVLLDLFVSWSGDAAKKAAEAFDAWIKEMIPDIKTWFSKRSIESGAQSREEINTALRTCKYGVAFVTEETHGSAWINFEAGALWKTLADQSLIHVVLLDNKRVDLNKPLGSFQSTLVESEDMFKLVSGINLASSRPQSAANLRIVFDKRWPELETALKRATEDDPGVAVKPSVQSPQEMILDRLASFDRTAAQLLAQMGRLEGRVEGLARRGSRLTGTLVHLGESLPVSESVSVASGITTYAIEFSSAADELSYAVGSPLNALAILHKRTADGALNCGKHSLHMVALKPESRRVGWNLCTDCFRNEPPPAV
jgi:hypothetical protein